MTKEQEIRRGNKLCAEFMGYRLEHRKFQYKNWNSSDEFYYQDDEGEIVCDEYGNEVNLPHSDDPVFSLECIPFNSDWNYLMEVVSKIEDLGYSHSCTNTVSTFMKVDDSGGQTLSFAKGDTKMEAIYKSVLTFIKWYNGYM